MARCDLIALDLDGTALLPDHTLAPETCRAIAAARVQGVRVVIATGRSSREAAWFAREGGFDSHAAALGGAGALMAASVKKLEIICWEDLGCEAVRRLVVADMPLTVILDSQGGDLYESGPAAYLSSL